MAKSIHTTKKTLIREQLFSANDDMPDCDGMTAAEEEDIKKRIYKLNAVWKRQLADLEELLPAALKLENGRIVRRIR